MPKRRSTGSVTSAVRSTTEVSKATTDVRRVRIEASTEANTPAYTIDSAIDPLWSMAMTTSRSIACWRRP
jgi:hypothetical protein